MEQLNGTVTLAYLDEDNKQRIFFRVVPLCTKEGLLFADAQTQFPDHGSLRVVPDKREQSTFKDRMRAVGPLCAVCLSGDAKEISKVRQNKNYSPQQGEYNQYAIYSDVVCGFEKDALFEVLDAEKGAFADAAPLTAQVLLLDHKVLYGPVERARLSDAKIADLRPYGNDHYLLHTVKLPDGSQRTLYWNPEATQCKRVRKPKAAHGAPEEAGQAEAQPKPAEPTQPAMVDERATASAMPAGNVAVSPVPVATPIAPAASALTAAPIAPAVPAPIAPMPIVATPAAPAPIAAPAASAPEAPVPPIAPQRPEPAVAPSRCAPQEEKPAEKPAEALPLGKPLQILDAALSFDAHLERLNQTVSVDANRIDEAIREIDEEPGEAAQYSGTPLERGAVRPPVIVGRPRPLHYVVEKQVLAAQNKNAAPDSPEANVEQAVQALHGVWQEPECHSQLLRALADDESFCFEFLRFLQENGCELRILAAVQAQMADIEAERLSLLMQVERLQGDRRKQEQEVLRSLTEQKKARIAELETAVSDLEAQRARLETATAALSDATRQQAESFVRANTWHGNAYDESIALLIPMVGVKREVPEMLDMLRKGLTCVGFDISEDDAYQLLIHFALTDELCLYGDNEQDALRFCKAFAHSLGLDKVSAFAQKDSQVRVVDTLAENACRSPLVLITQLSTRGQRSVGAKTLMYAGMPEYLAGEVPACPACPKVRIPSLSQTLPENAAAASAIEPISLASLEELQRCVAPLLDEEESWFAEVESHLADSALEISNSTLRDMRSFVSAASQKLRGGFLGAADAACSHWLVPLLLRDGGAEKISAIFASLPRSLSMLGIR